MKKLLFLFFLLQLTTYTKAQTGITSSSFVCQKISNNEYHFTFNTSFSMGYGSTCPPFTDYNIAIENDILLVKGYYDTTGLWPQVGCSRTNTVIYNNALPDNITTIKMSTNVTTYNNTPPFIPTTILVLDAYFQNFNVATLSIIEVGNHNNSIKLYPNPTKDILNLKTDASIKEIIIYDSLGKTVLKKNQNYDKIDVSTLNKGVYLIKIVDENDNSSFNKFLKE